eukprot:scaffold24089_cov124-Isochrysis_galbana.AAC.4
MQATETANARPAALPRRRGAQQLVCGGLAHERQNAATLPARGRLHARRGLRIPQGQLERDAAGKCCDKQGG